MSAKGRDHERQGRDHARHMNAKPTTMEAKAPTTAAILGYAIGFHKYCQAPHPPPLRKPSRPLISRFQPKYPNYHLWEICNCE